MKPNMKTAFAGVALLSISIINGCKKETAAPPVVTNTNTTSNYNMEAFFSQNGVPIQTFTVNAVSGGSFTTPQGTKVNIPANCFVTQSGAAVTGNVTIQFKDIYSKSDMLLSDVTTDIGGGQPLKSGGEFFIKAISNKAAVNMNGSAPITVQQPFNNWPADKNMAPFIKLPDSLQTWQPAPTPDTVTSSASGYVFALYSFGQSADSGTWCNSDNLYYFSAYQQVQFNIQTTDSLGPYYGYPETVDVFLDFTGINSLVHVYRGNEQAGVTSFPYNYAPLGLKCTVIAVETGANGQLRSAFVPTTITNGGTVNFTCTPTTFSAFKTTLATYNN